MKKILTIVFCLLLVACGKQKGDSALQTFVNTKLVKQKGTLRLSDFKEVKWDKLYVLGPYTNEKMYDARLATNKKAIIDSGVLTDDGVCYLMFFDGNNLVTSAVFERRFVDFSYLTRFSHNMKIEPYDKDKAIFPFEKRNKLQYVIFQL
ncbi:hypothetical protein [Mucilaginibacter sp. KACC 22063]|uniref:hypothetical protein n=1 Tax=Mucilaginibacter sp. KACC 22063 TaxID=3025666 RepID=UPI0023664261|nr:hypothetical protein [Mucilaginibacter sp. KACC 22063]WDF53518.1 hypothetical protein PQ461_11235 [Mucilaginibacter sp. KACC 22063]